MLKKTKQQQQRRINNVSIRQTLDVIEQRLETLLTIPTTERTDFVNGSVTQLEWCRDQITLGINSILPGGITADYDDDDDDDTAIGFLEQHSVSLIRPARNSSQPCKDHREHAYIFHSPQRNYKQCKHCSDVQRMIHGEKISFGRRTRKTA
jgi:hypothetical protein